LKVCTEHCDVQGDTVRIRLEEAPSDLHAADARYHNNCHKLFTNPKEIKSTLRNDPSNVTENTVMKFIIRSVQNEPDRIWNSAELNQLFRQKGGTEINSSRFMNI
jgi:CRISPR/Cas system-associated protein Csm6